MNKKALLSVLLLAGSALVQCASVRAPEAPALGPEPEAKRTWIQVMSGLVSDVTAASSQAGFLVTTVPDPDRKGAQTVVKSLWYSADGKIRWTYVQPQRVRAQSAATDGSLSVFATYDGRLSALDARGHLVWRIEASCRPIVIEKAQRIVCYHDDDPVPGIGFEVLDWNGKRLSAYRPRGDILALDVSPDQKAIAVGLTDGRVLLFEIDTTPKWETRLNGEIADLAVSSGADRRVAVLVADRKSLAQETSQEQEPSQKPQPSQKIVTLDCCGKKISSITPQDHFEQLKIDASGQWVFAYGNNAREQVVTRISGTPWSKREPFQADAPTTLTLVAGVGVAQMESIDHHADSSIRVSHVRGFSPTGDLLWSIPIPTEEGASLFAFSTDGGVIAVANDQGRLSGYRLK